MGDLERRLSAQTSINRIAALTRSHTFGGFERPVVESYEQVLDEYWNAAKLAHDYLITADDITTEVRETHDEALAGIEETYLGALAAIKGRLAQIPRTQPVAPRAEQAVHANHNEARMVELLEGVRLDSTKLTKFDGDRGKWLKFYEDFTVHVHNKEYPALVKMSRLRECLSGPALRVIDAASPANGDTYLGAWAALKERYDNKRFLANSHLTSMFDFKLNGKFDLLRLVDTFEATIRALNALEIDTANWDAVLSFVTLKKLDDATRAAWEMSQTTGEIPRFTELLAFIKRRASSFDFAQMGGSETRTPHTPRTRALVHSVTGTSPRDEGCVVCAQNHKILDCRKFKDSPPGRRFTLIRGDTNMCFNCLQAGHYAQSCPAGNCRFCDGRHHSAICRSDAAMAAFLAAQAKASARRHTVNSPASPAAPPPSA